MRPIGDGASGGRDELGRFGPGNRCRKLAVRGPYVVVAQSRGRLHHRGRSPRDRRKLVELARAGEAWAIREVLDRSLGRPVPSDLIERIEAIEAAADLREAAA